MGKRKVKIEEIIGALSSLKEYLKANSNYRDSELLENIISTLNQSYRRKIIRVYGDDYLRLQVHIDQIVEYVTAKDKMGSVPLQNVYGILEILQDYGVVPEVKNNVSYK